jgi:hypothetical protein
MIRKNEVERITNAYYEVTRVLSEVDDMYLTKEEIYMRFPRDEEGIPYITIGSLDNAIRNLVRMGEVEVAYVRGIRHFCINKNNDRRGWVSRD